MTAQDRLQELGLTLPEAPHALAAYVPTRTVPIGDGRSLLFVSGQLPGAGDGLVIGRVPDQVSPERAAEAARAAGLNLLAQIDQAAGLDNVEAIAQLTGYVNSTPDFGGQPAVVNGASELLTTVLGEAGRHTRAAVGVPSLPRGVAVEISAVVVVRSAP